MGPGAKRAVEKGGGIVGAVGPRKQHDISARYVPALPSSQQAPLTHISAASPPPLPVQKLYCVCIAVTQAFAVSHAVCLGRMPCPSRPMCDLSREKKLLKTMADRASV